MGGVPTPELPVLGGITQCYRHVGACGCMSYLSSRLRACTWGYSVCRVPTVAPGLTSGEAANPRVGPTYFSRAAFLDLVSWYFEAVARPCQWTCGGP
jgi:hypothetical protein